MGPMKLIPAVKDYLWGGGRLAAEYGKHGEGKEQRIAESWEVSCHENGLSRVANGGFAGRTLRDVLRRCPYLLGAGATGELPVLVKLIDAAQSTSVQVHPPDAFARAAEGQPGKNELWVVLDALPGAELVLGLHEPLLPDELRARIETGTLLSALNRVSVRAGDCFAIPAGMIHAIGAGVLLLEIQQSSDVTYRVYDYGRVDSAGNPRPLHIEKALEVIDTTQRARNAAESLSFTHTNGCCSAALIDWPYFRAELLQIDRCAALRARAGSFATLTVAEGTFSLEYDHIALNLAKGDSVFVPAAMGDYALIGTGKLLSAHL